MALLTTYTLADLQKCRNMAASFPGISGEEMVRKLDAEISSRQPSTAQQRQPSICPHCGARLQHLAVNDSLSTKVEGGFTTVKLCRRCYHEEWT